MSPILPWITSFLTAYLGQAIAYFAVVGLVFFITHIASDACRPPLGSGA